MVSNMLVFLKFLQVLEGLERSGRLIGNMFSRFSEKSDFMVLSYDQATEEVNNKQRLFQGERGGEITSNYRFPVLCVFFVSKFLRPLFFGSPPQLKGRHAGWFVRPMR